MQVMLCIWESKHTSGRHHRDRRISDILTYASYGFSNFWDGCKHPTCTPVVLHRYPFYSAGTSVRLRSQWYVYQLWVIHTSETCTYEAPLKTWWKLWNTLNFLKKFIPLSPVMLYVAV